MEELSCLPPNFQQMWTSNGQCDILALECPLLDRVFPQRLHDANPVFFSHWIPFTLGSPCRYRRSSSRVLKGLRETLVVLGAGEVVDRVRFRHGCATSTYTKQPWLVIPPRTHGSWAVPGSNLRLATHVCNQQLPHCHGRFSVFPSFFAGVDLLTPP